MNKVHAPNCLAKFSTCAHAPQGRRAVADAGRWAAFRAHPDCGKMCLSRR
jgi:hypothetical protein